MQLWHNLHAIIIFANFVRSHTPEKYYRKCNTSKNKLNTERGKRWHHPQMTSKIFRLSLNARICFRFFDPRNFPLSTMFLATASVISAISSCLFTSDFLFSLFIIEFSFGFLVSCFYFCFFISSAVNFFHKNFNRELIFQKFARNRRFSN